MKARRSIAMVLLWLWLPPSAANAHRCDVLRWLGWPPGMGPRVSDWEAVERLPSLHAVAREPLGPQERRLVDALIADGPPFAPPPPIVRMLAAGVASFERVALDAASVAYRVTHPDGRRSILLTVHGHGTRPTRSVAYVPTVYVDRFLYDRGIDLETGLALRGTGSDADLYLQPSDTHREVFHRFEAVNGVLVPQQPESGYPPTSPSVLVPFGFRGRRYLGEYERLDALFPPAPPAE